MTSLYEHPVGGGCPCAWSRRSSHHPVFGIVAEAMAESVVPESVFSHLVCCTSPGCPFT